ncbi:putative nucleoside-diphosphate-sugar epimerase [Rubidibacter lacunae KORDI 51-2]|uniref:Putative nucleoside-diphosphate-sugar epimerase n=1 Tax=Rubidibacter lacunae KORDI 51-2 TaxID=582515 RepID=U5DCZ9_9CHRO|nr:NAD(P)H-binding protein [Rubidibacter lacunae]ERN42398.1 putative nucleoside-diphosphate-sugar epimerase [Rubidibacter lacunae KORDI 51-2]
MKLTIVGASGTLGRQIARRAIDEGHVVRCLVRNPRKAAFLKEWGAEIVKGDICKPETLPPALEGADAVIDAATARPTESVSIRAVDWDGKVNLIQAAARAQVGRYVFLSILNAEAFPNVPLMEIKHCTETFLAESGLKYTILRPAGFMQGLIGQYAIPILDGQAVWVSGDGTPVAYMNTQDVAKFVVRAVEVPEATNRSFPVVGPRAWTASETIALCERLSDKTARISRLPLGLLRFMYRLTRFFAWTRNASDRLIFAEVLASDKPMNAPMDETYAILGLDPQEMSTLEEYLQDYFGRILKKLKEIGYEKEKAREKKKKKRSPFKTKS